MNSRKYYKIKAAIFTCLFLLFSSTISHTQAGPIPSLDYAAYEKDAPIEMVIQSPHNYINDLAFSPDGRYIASGSYDNTIKLWNVEGSLVKNIKHSKGVSCLAFSPDGSHFITNGDYKNIQVWSLDGELIKTLKGHSGLINSLAYSTGGKFILSGSLVSMVKGFTTYGIDQFASRYNRPDIILERLEAGSRELIARTVKGLRVSGKDGHDIKKRPHLYDTNRYIYNDLLRRPGAVIFSSSRGGEFSYERDDIQNGVFTEKIIDCLTNLSVDTNKDGLVSIKEMREFVAQSVAAETNDLQHPTVDRDNIYQNIGLPVIHLARSGCIQLIENNTAEYGSSIQSSWRMSGKSKTGGVCKPEWTMEEAYSGSRSLKIDNPDTNKNWGYWFQTITRDIPIGKKLSLSACIKTIDLEGVGAAIAIRGDDTIKRSGPDEYFFTTQKKQNIRGTKDWNEYYLQTPDAILENIKCLTIFLLLLPGSKGIVYFDNITLDF